MIKILADDVLWYELLTEPLTEQQESALIEDLRGEVVEFPIEADKKNQICSTSDQNDLEESVRSVKQRFIKVSSEGSDNFLRDSVNKYTKYSLLSLSRIPRDFIKYFEISVPRHISFAELRKKLFEQPHLKNIYVIVLLK